MSAGRSSCCECGERLKKVLVCTVCKDEEAAAYCSKECQKKAWKQHRKTCKPPPPPPQIDFSGIAAAELVHIAHVARESAAAGGAASGDVAAAVTSSALFAGRQHKEWDPENWSLQRAVDESHARIAGFFPPIVLGDRAEAEESAWRLRLEAISAMSDVADEHNAAWEYDSVIASQGVLEAAAMEVAPWNFGHAACIFGALARACASTRKDTDAKHYLELVFDMLLVRGDSGDNGLPDFYKAVDALVHLADISVSSVAFEPEDIRYPHCLDVMRMYEVLVKMHTHLESMQEEVPEPYRYLRPWIYGDYSKLLTMMGHYNEALRTHTIQAQAATENGRYLDVTGKRREEALCMEVRGFLHVEQLKFRDAMACYIPMYEICAEQWGVQFECLFLDACLLMVKTCTRLGNFQQVERYIEDWQSALSNPFPFAYSKARYTLIASTLFADSYWCMANFEFRRFEKQQAADMAEPARPMPENNLGKLAIALMVKAVAKSEDADAAAAHPNIEMPWKVQARLLLGINLVRFGNLYRKIHGSDGPMDSHRLQMDSQLYNAEPFLLQALEAGHFSAALYLAYYYAHWIECMAEGNWDEVGVGDSIDRGKHMLYLRQYLDAFSNSVRVRQRCLACGKSTAHIKELKCDGCQSELSISDQNCQVCQQKNVNSKPLVCKGTEANPGCGVVKFCDSTCARWGSKRPAFGGSCDPPHSRICKLLALHRSLREAEDRHTSTGDNQEAVAQKLALYNKGARSFLRRGMFGAHVS